VQALAHRLDSPFLRANWQAEALSWTEQAHLVAWSPSAAQRIAFATEMGQFIQAQEQMEVLPLYGGRLDGIEAFCQQLERSIPGPPLARRVDGPRGITNLLRSRDAVHCGLPSRHRFFIWHDADVLLRQDPRLFGALLDAMMGVAAEAEFVSDDMLLLSRVILVGGPPLVEYADDAAGQIRGWLPGVCGEPFWSLVTGLDRPEVRVVEIDAVAAREWGPALRA
jgi:diadenosine tetraphosphatase ApaH/serine/threonine PP2A family protein phosphatase